MRDVPFLILVVPCYNEEEVLPDTMNTLGDILGNLISAGAIKPNSCACYVDDGSRDRTWELIEARHEQDPACRGVKFAGNAGHQNAVWAGMEAAREWGADCIISLDADLQDDPAVIAEMIEKYATGCDIVYGVRDDRSSDTVFKRLTAELFYKLMGKLELSLVPNHADYRLVSRPVLEALRGFEEHTLFLRGLFPSLGFNTARVFYGRKARTKGESKYPFVKMVSFAWEGITSCSTAPLRIAGVMSVLCMLLALIICGVSVYKYLVGEVVQGWTSQIVIVLFLGSVQLFCLAVIGEYIGRIFTEVRHRPRYIVEKTI